MGCQCSSESPTKESPRPRKASATNKLEDVDGGASAPFPPSPHEPSAIVSRLKRLSNRPTIDVVSPQPFTPLPLPSSNEPERYSPLVDFLPRGRRPSQQF